MRTSRKFKFGVLGATVGVLIPAVAFATTIQVGMNVNLGWNVASADAPQVMSTLSSYHIKTVRQFFNWATIQPTSANSFTWTWMDTVMKNAAANGIDVLPVFYSTPGWANGNQPSNVLPTDLSTYTNFVKAAFLRYGAAGSFWALNPGPRSPLVSAEIWNEPWCKTYFSTTDPQTYANLLRVTAKVIRSVDPTVKILASSDYYNMTGTTNPWLPALLSVMPDFASFVDVADVHLYFPNYSIPTGTTSYQKLDQIRAALTSHGLTEPIWITESGINARMVDQYQLNDDTTGISSQAYAITATAYSAILTTINSMAVSDGIQRYYCFLYQRTPTGGTNPNDGFSLANQNLQPTVAAQAIFSWVATHPNN